MLFRSGKRCVEPRCEKGAADSSSSKCILHGGGKRCIEPGCENGAIDTMTNKCRSHGGGRRCTELGCGSGAADTTTNKCGLHGGGRRCIEPGCDKGAADYKTNKCVTHGGGPRCPNCITWPDSRGGNPKYDGYCATCFKRIFPNDERSKVIYAHTKEIRVRNAINLNFTGFIHDMPIYTHACECTHRRRIDHRRLIANTMLCIETDEFGHSRYDAYDEEIRYDDLYMVFSGKWIFIRFNPDGAKDVDFEDKLEVLINEIHSQIERIENDENENLLEIIKLFY